MVEVVEQEIEEEVEMEVDGMETQGCRVSFVEKLDILLFNVFIGLTRIFKEETRVIGIPGMQVRVLNNSLVIEEVSFKKIFIKQICTRIQHFMQHLR